jgi:hypothetical protein
MSRNRWNIDTPRTHIDDSSLSRYFNRSSSQPTHNVITIESMNFRNIAEPKHHSDKVIREETTDHSNLSQFVPTNNNLDNLNGKDSGITSPVDSISTQSFLMLMVNKKTKRSNLRSHQVLTI